MTRCAHWSEAEGACTLPRCRCDKYADCRDTGPCPRLLWVAFYAVLIGLGAIILAGAAT